MEGWVDLDAKYTEIRTRNLSIASPALYHTAISALWEHAYVFVDTFCKQAVDVADRGSISRWELINVSNN